MVPAPARRAANVAAVHGRLPAASPVHPPCCYASRRAAGAPSRAYLLDSVTGPERRALAWVLRDAGDRLLSAERCRDLAAELRKWEE